MKSVEQDLFEWQAQNSPSRIVIPGLAKAFFTTTLPLPLRFIGSILVKNTFLCLGINGKFRARPLLLLLVGKYLASGSILPQNALTLIPDDPGQQRQHQQFCPTMETMNEAEVYLQKAEKQNLPPALARISLSLTRVLNSSSNGPVQPHHHLWEAYAAAQVHAPGFERRLSTLGLDLGAVASIRPGGIKSLERSFEKMAPDHPLSPPGKIPLDLVAGKLTFARLEELYRAALEIPDRFQVVYFKDRFVFPQASGYRDLQFVVQLEDAQISAEDPLRGWGTRHLAELKLTHTTLDALDAYEHRVYEMLRSVQLKVRQSPGRVLEPEQLVLDTYGRSSTQMYHQAWQRIVKTEGGAHV